MNTGWISIFLPALALPALSFAQPELLVSLSGGNNSRLRDPIIADDGGVYCVQRDAFVLRQDGSTTSAQVLMTVSTLLPDSSTLGGLHADLPLTPVGGGSEVIVAGRNTTPADSAFAILRSDGSFQAVLRPESVGNADLTFLSASAVVLSSSTSQKLVDPGEVAFATFFLQAFGLAEAPTSVHTLHTTIAGQQIGTVTVNPAPVTTSVEVIRNAPGNVSAHQLIPTDRTLFNTTNTITLTPPPVENFEGPSAPPGLVRIEDFGTTDTVAVANRVFDLPLIVDDFGIVPITLTSWEQATLTVPTSVDGGALFYVRGSQDDFRSSLVVVQNPEERGKDVAAEICARGDVNSDGKTDGEDVSGFTDLLLKKDSKADLNQDGKVNDKDLKLFMKCVNQSAGGGAKGPVADEVANRGFVLLATNNPVPTVDGAAVDFVTNLRGNGLGATFVSVQAKPTDLDTITYVLRFDENGFSEVMRTGVDYGGGTVTAISGFSNVNPRGEMAVVTRQAGNGYGLYRVSATNLTVEQPPAPSVIDQWQVR